MIAKTQFEFVRNQLRKEKILGQNIQDQKISEQNKFFSIDANKIFQKSLTHLLNLVSETILVDDYCKGKSLFGERKIICQDLEIVKKFINEGNQILAISGHLGSFELLAAFFAKEGYEVTTVSRSANYSSLLFLINKIRSEYGVKSLWRSNEASVSVLRECLKKGNILAVLLDQDTALKSAFVPFFGLKAAHPVIPVELALRRNLKIVLAFIVREKVGLHRIIIKEVPITESTTSEDVLNFYAQTLENLILDYPEQWLWWHRRWRRVEGVDYFKEPQKLNSTKEYLKRLSSI